MFNYHPKMISIETERVTMVTRSRLYCTIRICEKNIIMNIHKIN